MENFNWIDIAKLAVSLMTIALAIYVTIWGNDQISKRREKRKMYEKMLNSFHRPILQAFTTSKMLREVLAKDKPTDFRALRYLISKRDELTESDKKLISEIVQVGKEIEQIIQSNSGDILNSDLREEVGILARHLRIFRFVSEQEAEYKPDQFNDFVYPREINDLIEREHRILSELSNGEEKYEKYKKNGEINCKNKKCYLCGQIKGQIDNDLIHILSKKPKYLYKRTVLYENQYFSLIPSIGPLMVGHILICPRDHFISMAALSDEYFNQLKTFKKEVHEKMTDIFNEPIHFFEHGNSKKTKRTLCSTEHAHLHAFPSSTQNYIQKTSTIDFEWNYKNVEIEEINRYSKGNEYLYYETSDGDNYLKVINGDQIESQYLRRLISEINGNSRTWNWKEYPKLNLMDETINRFKNYNSKKAPCTASYTKQLGFNSL
ncbi:HIT domain-containing protein [Maribellus luteus]|uniref:HIT domain-containing protein n=1 Tax=Maribellus luteus TaxID=2305463 RepID=A0A399T3A0_9BACT|nr:HIT domain-containing protein [Maribellus luteus]RIJ49345.1 HIT domain-containing protein [Maribellus luteus]